MFRNIGFYIDEQTNRSGHEVLDTPLHRLFPPNIDVKRKPNYSFANLLLKEGADPRIKNLATGDLFYTHASLPRRTQNLKDASGRRAVAEEIKLEQARARLKKAEEMEREKKRFKEVVNPDGKVMMGKLIEPVEYKQCEEEGCQTTASASRDDVLDQNPLLHFDLFGHLIVLLFILLLCNRARC